MASWQEQLDRRRPLLLIDDDALIAMGTGSQLEESGRFKVTTIDAFPQISTAILMRQTAEWVRRHPDGVVVSDQQRPSPAGGTERYGNQIVAAARRAGFRGPAIIYSAGDSGLESEEAKSAGADAFVPKSDGVHGISEAIERLREKTGNAR